MKDDKSKQFMSVASCGVEFVSAIIVGILIGAWIDKYFDKFPLFLILFFILGCISGYFNILKYMDKSKK
ncbi:MAG: AtpZ/AtpI family protein [Holosporaceae bacterium]|nr:AtpZ/AtpI family protein [Holosporaceae bacterium]